MITRKKPKATQGTVVRQLKDTQVLQEWAQELSQCDFFQKASLTKDVLHKQWTDHQSELRFFSATNPKEIQSTDFSSQFGLLIFSDQKAQEMLQSYFSIDITLPSNGGLILYAFAREGHKTLMKYLLLAAERVVHEKQNQVFCLVLDGDSSMARFVKSAGYEELAAVESKSISGLKGLIFHKLLTS